MSVRSRARSPRRTWRTPPAPAEGARCFRTRACRPRSPSDHLEIDPRLLERLHEPDAMHVLGGKPAVVLPDEDSEALELPHPLHRGARAFRELSFREAHRPSVLPLATRRRCRRRHPERAGGARPFLRPHGAEHTVAASSWKLRTAESGATARAPPRSRRAVRPRATRRAPAPGSPASRRPVRRDGHVGVEEDAEVTSHR